MSAEVAGVPPDGTDGTGLDAIVPMPGGRPKGLVPYRPQGKSRVAISRVLRVYSDMESADALPLGPRQCGYRLKETYPGEYAKKDFEGFGDKIVRLQQSGDLPWSWVADGSAVTYEPGGWESPASFLADVPGMYERDRTVGQPVVAEIFTEARETLPLIRRLAGERGVTAYSGGGSCGPNLARKAAARALRRAVARGQSTVFFGVCDFDLPGVKNILRPHIENVSAFLYGTAGNRLVIATKNDAGEFVCMADTGCTATLRHLALTAEMAERLAEDDTDRARIRRYIASGADIWSRDLDLLQGVQKIETEALDPVQLRDLVIAAIDATLDTEALRAAEAGEAADVDALKSRLAAIPDDWSSK